MSNDQNKPGFGNIGDLKARLGNLQAGNTGGPAPTPTPSFGGMTGNVDDAMGGDTAVVRLDDDAGIARPTPRPAVPAPTPSAAPLGRSAPPKPAGGGFNLSGPPKPLGGLNLSGPPKPLGGGFSGGLGNLSGPPKPAGGLTGGLGDLGLNKPAGTPAPMPSAPVKPAGGLDLGGDLFSKPAAAAAPEPQMSQEDLAAQFEAELADEPQHPEGATGFANPLQRGEYTQAAASIDLTAADEEALAAFEGKQAGMKPVMAFSLIGVAFLLALVVGLSMGSVRSARKQINTQIKDSRIIAERMMPHIEQLKVVSPIIQGMGVSLRQNPNAVDWDKMKYLPQMEPLDPGLLLVNRVPLHPDLSRVLNNAVVDMNKLFVMINDHRRLTNQVDKEQLEAIEKGDDWTKHPRYVVTFTPAEAPAKGKRFTKPPTDGVLAAIIGAPKLNDETDKYEMLVLKRNAEKPEPVTLESIVGVNKKDIFSEGGATVLDLYKRRVVELNLQLKKILEYQDMLVTVLKRESARTEVFSF